MVKVAGPVAAIRPGCAAALAKDLRVVARQVRGAARDMATLRVRGVGRAAEAAVEVGDIRYWKRRGPVAVVMTAHRPVCSLAHARPLGTKDGRVFF